MQTVTDIFKLPLFTEYYDAATIRGLLVAHRALIDALEDGGASEAQCASMVQKIRRAGYEFSAQRAEGMYAARRAVY